MMFILLFVLSLYADSVDQIHGGKFSDKTSCVLCGGRLLCGAIKESLSLEVNGSVQTSSVTKFCYRKTIDLRNVNRQHRPWITEEAKRFQKISDLPFKISQWMSRSKYTQEVPVSITKEKLQARAEYRMENGFKFVEVKAVLGKDFKTWENENLILPLLSFESFSAIKGRDRDAYHRYVQDLMVANVRDIMIDPSAYAFLYESKSDGRQIASDPPLSSLTKEDLGKPHDYYSLNDVDSLLEKMKLLPDEFCEKNMYKNVQHATQSALSTLAKTYGGDSPLEISYHEQKLKQELASALKASTCPKEIQSLLHDKIRNLPNPKIKQKVDAIKFEAKQRMPSSSERDSARESARDLPKPVYCEFDINNYLDKCPPK